MEYLAVKWNISDSDAPVHLYSELDSQRMETRKVEIYRNGRAGWADRQRQHGDTELGREPVPSLAELSTGSEFEAKSISKSEFEEVWRKATSPVRVTVPLHEASL